MTIYLTIITTVLVATQVIRLIQNTIQLKHLRTTKIENAEILKSWNELKFTLENFITKFADESDNK